ncbi:MAG: ADP-ribosylglycohydrolase family protein, partial [Planctomycetota bacterium]
MRRLSHIVLFVLLIVQFSCFVRPSAHAEDILAIDREAYQEKLEGFWLGQCIANWTGLRTEGARKQPPFLTDSDWGKRNGQKYPGQETKQMIEFVLVPRGEVWGADDDTDIEYIYQELLVQNQTALLNPEQIRDGWLRHIKLEEPNYLWVSNETALHLMAKGLLPPETSLPENNKNYLKIDAQLTTEIFGLLSPTRPDFAIEMANLPIRTTAYQDSQWISEFYVAMHALVSVVDPELSSKEKMFWLADQAKSKLPEGSVPRKIYDFVLAHYLSNADKDDWESTRD